MIRKLLSLIALSFLLLSGCASFNNANRESPEVKRANISKLRTNIAVQYLNLKDYRNAVDSIQAAINADPNYSYAWMVKGIIHQAIKDNAVAENSFKKALSIDPNSAEINNNYGWFICDGLKKPPESLVYFDKALTDLTYPTPHLSYMNKGICFGRMGRFSEAEANLNKAIAANPAFTYSVVELSRVQSMQGNYRQAKRTYDDFVSKTKVLRPEDLMLGYDLTKRLGLNAQRREILDILRHDYPYAEETLQLSKEY